MGLFGKILATGFDIVTSPVEVAKDVATLGGLVTDRREPYTATRLKQIAEDAEGLRDELEDI